MTSTNFATVNTQSQTANVTSLQSATTPPLDQLLKATNANDFATARQILNDNPTSKDALMASLSKSDLGAFFRLSNFGTIAALDGVTTASAPSKVLVAGNVTTANLEINMGQNHKPDIFEKTARLFGNNTFQSFSSDNQVARYVAKTQFGISVKGQLDGSGTISLPNTRAGGEILAKIQTTSVGFSGMGIEGNGWLKIPQGASKEFMAGFNDVVTKFGWAAFGNAVMTIGGGSIAARNSRPNINITPNQNIPTQSAVNTPNSNRVTSQPTVNKSGKLDSVVINVPPNIRGNTTQPASSITTDGIKYGKSFANRSVISAGRVNEAQTLKTNADVPARYTADKRFNSLATDPAHAGKAIDYKTRVEAMSMLQAEKDGIVRAPFKRGPTQIEGFDAAGQPWDVKAPLSGIDKKGRSFFDVNQTGMSLKTQLGTGVKKDAYPPKGTYWNGGVIPGTQIGSTSNVKIILNVTYLNKSDHAALNQWMKTNLSVSEQNRIFEVNTQK